MLSVSVLSNSLRPHGLYPSRLLCPQNVPGKNTGVGCNFLLQGIFLTQESNLGLQCRQIFYWFSHQGSPFILTACSIYITRLRDKARMGLTQASCAIT